MQKGIKRKINAARLRLAFIGFLDIARRVFLYAGIVFLMFVLTEKLLAVSVLNLCIIGSFSAVFIVALLIWWLLKIPSKRQTSLLIDERLNLKERMSSLLSLENKEDPFAQAACQEASGKIMEANLKGFFPIRITGNWFYSMGLWAAVILIIAFFPQYDLLGYLQREKDKIAEVHDVQVAEKTVKLTAGSVKMAIQELGDESLNNELEKLDQVQADQSPEAIKRQAIQKLGALSDRIEQLKKDMNPQSLEMTKDMLKQLKPMAEPFSQPLQFALMKGDFSAARDMITQLQSRLEKGELTDEQKKRLAEQLANMAKQLEQVAAKNKELEEALDKAGLDRKLSQLSEEEFKKALEKVSLNPKQMQQLMQKFNACKSACKNCSNLAQAMAACSGGASPAGDQMDELAAQLSALEAFEHQMDLMEASLAEIEGAIGALGQGLCQGPGCDGWTDLNQPGNRAGTGFGKKYLSEPIEADPKATKVKGKPQEGQVVASWFFKGEQIKGQSTLELDQVIQTAKDNAAEAISENAIPKRYEESVKMYFGGLEEYAEE